MAHFGRNGGSLSPEYAQRKQVMKEETKAWQNHRNNKKANIDWQFKNEEARIKLKKLYPSIKV